MKSKIHELISFQNKGVSKTKLIVSILLTAMLFACKKEEIEQKKSVSGSRVEASSYPLEYYVFIDSVNYYTIPCESLFVEVFYNNQSKGQSSFLACTGDTLSFDMPVLYYEESYTIKLYCPGSFYGIPTKHYIDECSFTLSQNGNQSQNLTGPWGTHFTIKY